jgi:hypothetical protein
MSIDLTLLEQHGPSLGGASGPAHPGHPQFLQHLQQPFSLHSEKRNIVQSL